VGSMQSAQRESGCEDTGADLLVIELGKLKTLGLTCERRGKILPCYQYLPALCVHIKEVKHHCSTPL